MSVQIEKHDDANMSSNTTCHHMTHDETVTQSTSTPLDANNFKFALHLQHDDHQAHSGGFIHMVAG